MMRLRLHLLRNFLPVLLASVLFFVLILELLDLFTNLVKYLNYEVPFLQICRVLLLYAPKCVSYALPISLLFAVSFTLGNMYSNNELIAIFGSGVSLSRFVLPFVVLGLVLSVGGFFFEDRVVIDSLKAKSSLTRQLLRQRVSYSNSDLTVISASGRIVYRAEYFNDAETSISGVTVVVRDESGKFLERLNAQSAKWEGKAWRFSQARLYRWNDDGSALSDAFFASYGEEALDEPPASFRKSGETIQEMRLDDARDYVEQLKAAGLPFAEGLSEYYRRFAFAFAPLIVTLLSAAIGGRFKKNILLMSLLASLVAAVIFYVAQMMTSLMAKLEYMSPLAGAAIPIAFFLLLSLVMFERART
jgi:lipopolysaccharide export system permease protein